MTQSFMNMMYLLSCSALGIEPDISKDLDLIKIYELSKSQGVWPLVFLTLKRAYKSGKLAIDNKIFNNWNKAIMLLLMSNAKKDFVVYNTIKQLEEDEIPYCILKGKVISQLYVDADFRISSDTDILVEKDYIKKVSKIMEKNGFDVRSRYHTSHHIKCYHPIGGLVELHLSLHDELVEDVWFDNSPMITEECRRIELDSDFSAYTLGITDGLIFIMFHLIKHFLKKGVGIRQLMDSLIYMKHYKNEINWDRFNELMRHLKFDRFIDNIIGIGVKYLNFSNSDFNGYNCDDGLISEILNDIEAGGIFGNEEKDRQYFYKKYNEERFKRFKNEDYYKYMSSWYTTSIFKLIFPNIKVYYLKYPYVKKMPFLLPIAWLVRTFKFVIAMIKKEQKLSTYTKYTTTDADNASVEKRMDLIHRLDMV